jgi:protocatechuate 3,4-dioxygenase beta subunit
MPPLLPDTPTSTTRPAAGIVPATSAGPTRVTTDEGRAADDATGQPLRERATDLLLRGRVVDPRRLPVPGARVHLLRSGEPAEDSQTAADGTFAVAIAPVGSPVLTLIAHDPRWAPAVVQHGIVAGAEPTADLGDLVLADGGAIDGIVFDDEGRPCLEAHVCARPVHGALLALPAEERARWLPEQRVFADGRFTCTGLPAGAYVVEAWAPDRQRRNTPPCAVHAGATTSLAPLVLGPGCTLAGTVVDRLGRPVAAATVDLLLATAPDLRNVQHATTDAHGAFVFAHLPPAPHHLRIADPGRRTHVQRDLDPLRTPNVTVRLQDGASLRGQVHDAVTGRGLSRGRVRLLRTDAPQDSGDAAQTRETARLRAAAADLQASGRDPEALASTLRALAELEQQRRHQVRERAPFGDATPVLPAQDLRPAAAGRFEFTGLEDGSFCVEIEAPGRSPVRTEPVAVRAGAAPAALAITIPAEPAGR